MDERRRDLADLKKRIEDYGDSLEKARESIGAAAMADPRADSFFPDELAEAQRIERDLAEARSGVRTIEDDTEKLRALEADERNARRELDARGKELVDLRTRLGEAVLGSSAPIPAADPYRQRIEALAARIEEQESRIAELETIDGGGGLIAHIGRSARSALIRASQTARRAEGRRILAETGAALAEVEEFRSSEDDAVRAAAEALRARSEEARRLQEGISSAQAAIKDLRARISAECDGNRRRTIARYQKAVAEGGERLATVRRGVGALLLEATAKAKGAKGGRDALAEFASAFLAEGAVAETAAKAAASADSIRAAKRQTEKLDAALKIDALTAGLSRLRSVSADHERRIAASTRALEDVNRRIAETEREIASLSKLAEGR